MIFDRNSAFFVYKQYIAPILLKLNRYGLILSVDSLWAIFDGKETKLKSIKDLLPNAQNLVKTKKSNRFSKMMKISQKMEFRVRFQNSVKT